MTSIAGRLKLLLGKTSREIFAKKIGVSLNTILRYETGVTYPGSKFISKICTFFNLSADYLIFGNNNIFGNIDTYDDLTCISRV